MFTKSVRGLLFIVLLLSPVFLAIEIQPVKAEGTIYIRADGSIDPPTAPISSVDNITYVLLENIYEESIVVERDHITVDGAGLIIQGTKIGAAIGLSDRNNVTVKNFEIVGFLEGISLVKVSNSTISGNKIVDNGIIFWTPQGAGIHLYDCRRNNFTRNDIEGNVQGVVIEYPQIGPFIVDEPPHNRFWHNNFVDNQIQAVSGGKEEIWDDGYPSGGNYWSSHLCVGNPSNGSSPYIILTTNVDHYPFQNADGWLSVHNMDTGLSYETIQEAVDAPETVNEHTILVDSGVYNENLVLSKSLTVMGNDASHSIIESSWPSIEVHADSVVIRNLSIRVGGIYLLSSANHCSIMDNLIDSCEAGLTIGSISGVPPDTYIEGTNVFRNVFTHNNRLQHFWVSSAIEMHNAQNIHIANNYFDENFETIWFCDSVNRNVTITQNQILNSYSSAISNYGWGLSSWGQENITILGNVIANSSDAAIWLYGSNIRIIGNTFISNNGGALYGMEIRGNNSLVFHNNFLNSTVYVAADLPNRFWNSSCEGNYWSDYNGPDLDGDGIGDEPYVIDANNQDNYPLMSPYLCADVNHDAVVNMTDISLCSDAFGSYPGHPRWNPHYDINEDNMINMRDIGIACNNFMKKWE